MKWCDLFELLGTMSEVEGDQPIFVWNQKDSTTFRVERMDEVGPWKVLVVNAKKPDDEEMDSYTATMIAEEVMDATHEERIKAWQYLLDTGVCWDLQGRFGRGVIALVEDGVLSPISMSDEGDYIIHPIIIDRFFNKGDYTYKRIESGVSLNGYMCKGLPLYVWNDSGCEIGGGTPYADYITINNTIIYLRDMEETNVQTKQVLSNNTRGTN